ncbi:MAG: hypothetical protein EBZ59_11995 [Planctomycetia bacterium]|nr:hypothetical protein [Planctomycetia bacterium]
MTPDFDLFDVLTRHGVPFVVVGGHAVNFHGFIRGTEDTDVLWIRSPAAEVNLLEALDELAAEYIGDEIDPATGIERTHPVTEAFIRAERLMTLCTRAGFLDRFDYVPGHPSVPVTAVWEMGVDLDGIRFASLEWLRKLKQAAGRPKDLLDLEQLAPAGGNPGDGRDDRSRRGLRRRGPGGSGALGSAPAARIATPPPVHPANTSSGPAARPSDAARSESAASAPAPVGPRSSVQSLT